MSLLDMINQQRAKLQRGNNNRPEKLNSEKNLIRVLPAWDGKETTPCWQDWGQHFIKDTAGAIKAVYICTQTMFGEDCDICNHIAAGAAMTSDEEVLKALKDARSSRRILVNAMYLKGGKHDNPEKNPVVLDLPPTVFDSILATYQAYIEEGINVFSLDEGLNFIVEKTGSGMGTEYKVTPAPKSTKIDKVVMTQAKDLATWARQESEAEKAKAVTSVRVISGNMSAAPATAPRLAGPGKAESRLADVHADAIDAEYKEVPITGKSDLDAELDDFLNDLD